MRARAASFFVGALLSAMATWAAMRPEPSEWQTRVLIHDDKLPVIEVYIPERMKSFAICFPASDEFSAYSCDARVFRRRIMGDDWGRKEAYELMQIEASILVHSRADYANGEFSISPVEVKQ